VNKRALALVALVVVLLAAAVWFGRPGISNSETPATVAQPGARPVATPMTPGTDSSRPGPGSPAPWAAGGSSLPPQQQSGMPDKNQPAPAGTAASAPHELKELEKMQQALAESMRGGKQPDTRQVLELLNQMKQKYGSTAGGVNLDAVITNLQVAQDIQVVAVEMQTESAKSGGGDRKKLQSSMEKLTKLQSQLRTDIAAPNTLGNTK
jgi:hypothetical protein